MKPPPTPKSPESTPIKKPVPTIQKREILEMLETFKEIKGGSRRSCKNFNEEGEEEIPFFLS